MAMPKPEMPPIFTAPSLLANETTCYSFKSISTNQLWTGLVDPLDFALPSFLAQILLIAFTTRLLMFTLKPLYQPRVLCEFIAGIILGPTAFGQFGGFPNKIFGKEIVLYVEIIGSLGITYFAFMIGLEMDLKRILKQAKKASGIALAGMCLPFLTACGFSFLLQKTTTMQQGPFIILYGISLSVTGFSVLTRNLGELQIVDKEIISLAKTAALISNCIGVLLYVLAVSSVESQKPIAAFLWIVISSICFVAFCILLVQPGILWLIRRTSEEENTGNFTTSVIFSGAMLSGIIADAIGVYPMFGAFVFGLVVPSGPLAVKIIEQLEDLVTGFLLPLFFATSGLKTNIYKIQGATTWVALMFAIIIATAGKVTGTILLSLLWKMPLREGISLGFLMNSTGLIELIALNIGKDQKVIDDTGYAIMMVTMITMNVIVAPVLAKLYWPVGRLAPYKRRTIEAAKENSELRILTCIHTQRNIPTIINLLELSQSTKRSKLSVFSLHLVELTGNASASFIDHNSENSSDMPMMNKIKAMSDHIIDSFERFKIKTDVSVHSFTTISPYTTMHQEISILAEEKRASIVIVPFHKQQTVDGAMETGNREFQKVGQNLLVSAPCAVGILVDRGLNGSTRMASGYISHKIAVLFIGGPDDREALAYAVRLSEHPLVSLDVIQFLPGSDAVQPRVNSAQELHENVVLTLEINQDRDKLLDDDCIRELKMRKANDASFSHIAKVVNCGEEMVAAIRSVETFHDLFIVGRAEGILSPLTSGLSDWMECPELGVVGDLLASSDFSSSASVLVVQQFVGQAQHDEWTPDRVSVEEE